MSKNGFLFPGQGAQFVGMGRDLCETFALGREIFDRAEAATGLPIKALCFDGPEDELTLTRHAQPCIFTMSVAALESWRSLLPPETEVKPDLCAGLSLGEYTALYAAGAMDFETGVKLVARRGELMQQAATERPSGMVAVMGLDEAQAEALCEAAREGQILSCANFNCPGQIVLSGENEACQRAAEKAESFGAMGAKVLEVAGAFHSEIMAPAADAFAEVLAGVEFADPKVPVLANVDAEYYASAADIPVKLKAQLTGAVRWQQCMERALADGMDRPYEIGPGKVLFGLMRRIDRKCRVTLMNSAEALEKETGVGREG